MHTNYKYSRNTIFDDIRKTYIEPFKAVLIKIKIQNQYYIKYREFHKKKQKSMSLMMRLNHLIWKLTERYYIIIKKYYLLVIQMPLTFIKSHIFFQFSFQRNDGYKLLHSLGLYNIIIFNGSLCSRKAYSNIFFFIWIQQFLFHLIMFTIRFFFYF